MAECHIVAAGDFTHITLRECREERHDQAQRQGTGENQCNPFKTGNGQDNADHTGHIKRVMSGQKHIF